MPRQTFLSPLRFFALLVLGALFAVPTAFAQFTISSNTTTSSTQTLHSGTGTINAGVTLTYTGSAQAVNVTGTSTLVNSGTISVTSTGGSAGRGVRDNTGGLTLTFTNNAGAVIETADADAFQMNKANSNVTLNNFGSFISNNASAGGAQAIDWNAITTGSNTLNNFSTGLLEAFEADAVRPGVNGVINNSGTIKSVTATGSSSDGIDAQTNTGVSVTNSGLVEGGRHGITGGNTTGTGTYTMSVTNNSGGVIQGDNGSGINIDGINANEQVTIINNGTITGNGHDIGDGTGHDGDGVDVDGVVNLTNTGTIKSLNSFGVGGIETSEGVTVGGGTIVNSGTIEGDVASGNNTAVGRGITLAGVDKDANDNPIPVQGIYANSSVTNSGLIRGQTDSGIAVLGPATGFTVTINNQAGGVIEGAGATAATIQTGDDNDTVTNAGSIINDGGNAKTAVSLGGGDDHLTVTGGSAVIIGGIDGGSGNNTLTFDLGAASNIFSHAGAISNFSTVEALSGLVTLAGANTYTGVTNIGGGPIAAVLNVTGTHSGGGNYSVLNNGTLAGTGIISLASPASTITVAQGGILAPGTGALTIGNGSVVLNGTVDFSLAGTVADAIGGYNQIIFDGSNTGGLALGADSTLNLTLGFTPHAGDQFELFDFLNDSSTISGTFAGLAQGSTFSVDGTTFEINYAGGTGNDLVLTAIPEPVTWAAFAGVVVLGFAILRRRSKAAMNLEN